MKLSQKTWFAKSLAIASLAAIVVLAAPAQASAQGFGFAVQIGGAYPAAYAPGYGHRFFGDGFRHEEWRQHEEWIQQQEWLRHQEWERSHAFYGSPPYAPAPFGYRGR